MHQLKNIVITLVLIIGYSTGSQAQAQVEAKRLVESPFEAPQPWGSRSESGDSQNLTSTHSHEGDDSYEFGTPENPETITNSQIKELIETLGCATASSTQISVVNAGNAKKVNFLDQCYAATGHSKWCDQLVRPNPDSVSTFRCTYGSNIPHQLIHPDEQTWKYAVKAVQLVQQLETKGIRTCQIYNWWRPEPYNKNVGGAAGRHPFGTSVDVRLCSDKEAITAFNELCKLRKQGQLRAIGYYGGSALHFGVGDATANTWGRTCAN